MRQRAWSMVIWGLMLAAPRAVAAEAPAAAWERLTAEYTALYQQQQFAPAADVAQQALQAAEQAFGATDPRTAQVWNDLGRLYAEQGQHEQALDADQRALQIRRQQTPPVPAALVQSLRNLTRDYVQLKRWPEAAPLLEEAIVLLAQELPADHPHRLDAVADLALLRMEQEQYAVAEPLFAELATQASALKGLDQTKLAFLWHQYGKCLAQLGRAEEAAQFEKRAGTLQTLISAVKAMP